MASTLALVASRFSLLKQVYGVLDLSRAASCEIVLDPCALRNGMLQAHVQ